MNQKLDVARVFERIFQIYKDQFTLLIPAALVVFVPVAIISGLIYAGDVGLLGALLVAALATIATYWFQGMVVEAAEDLLDGRRDHTVGSLLRSVTPVLGALIVVGILAGIAIGIGLLLLIVPGLFLLTIWAVLAPVVVLEKKSAFEAFGRSRELVRGHGWQVFGVIVVLFLLQFIISAVIQAIANGVSDSFAAFALSDLIVRLLVAPLSALAAAVLYFELRARKEGAGTGPDTLTQPVPATSPTGGPPPPAAPEAPSGAPQAPPATEAPGGAPQAPGGTPQAPPPPGGPSAPQAPPPGGERPPS